MASAIFSKVRGAWNSREHPRGPDGKFINAGKVSFRLSTRSATVMYGVTVPIVPGKANLYVGALARVERARGHETALEKKVKGQAADLAAKHLPAKITRIASKGGIETPGGTTFVVQRPRVRGGQVRASRKLRTVKTPAATHKTITGVREGVRSPNRKARAPRALPKSTAPAPAVRSSKSKKVTQ